MRLLVCVFVFLILFLESSKILFMEICADGYLRVYLKGQEVRNEYDKPDNEYCGQVLPNSVVAQGPRLLMVFSSGNDTGLGFKANYKFETEYKIPGTASPDGQCIFTYLSSSQKSGGFNSPRNPSNYPSNTTCQYIFKPQPDEVVEIVFITFKIRNEDSDSLPEGAHRCHQDWLEVYNIYKGNSYSGDSTYERLNGRYCGYTPPGPTQSEKEAIGLRVELHTDHKLVYSGFDAVYHFKKKEETFGKCGGNITNSISGIITTPNFPNNYGAPDKRDASYCDWYIEVKDNHKVLLKFEIFSVEGNPDDRGCPAATVRVYKDPKDKVIDMCGESLPPEQIQILSNGSLLRVNFLAAARAVGAKGFKAVWTQVKDGPDCKEFQCRASKFCINRKLRCDGIVHCGLIDYSDEEGCDKASEVNVLMLTGVVLGISSLLAITVCMYCQRSRNQNKKENSLSQNVHVYERGARFAAMDSADRNISPVLMGTRKSPHYLSQGSLRIDGIV